MTKERYFHWMAVWRWFQHERLGGPRYLYELLNEMWQQDRQASTEEQLAEYARAWKQSTELEREPEFQAFMQGLDNAFTKKPKPPKE